MAAHRARYRYRRVEQTDGQLLAGDKPPGRRRRSTFPRKDAAASPAWPTHAPVRRPNAPNASNAKTIAPAPVPANTWQLAQMLFAETYASVFSLTPLQARACLRGNDTVLYDAWRDNVEDFHQVAWVPSPPEAPRSPHDIAYAATRFSRYLHGHADLTDADARATALLYLTHPPVEIVEGDLVTAVYQDVLQRRLEWIDTAKVRDRNMTAEQILKVVCRQRRQAVPTKAELDRRLRNVRDVIVDEAALIHFHAGRRGAASSMPMSGSIGFLRAQFVTALIDDWQDAGIGVRLIPSSPVAPAHTAFWHDGMVLQNSRGKNMQQIADALFAAGSIAPESVSMQRLMAHAGRDRHLAGQPDDLMSGYQRERLLHAMHGNIAAASRYEERDGAILIANVWLTKGELLKVVEKTFRSLALDSVYPGGTPLHAAATVLLQQGPMHGVHFDRPDDPTALMHAFDTLNHAWHLHPRTPVEPRMSAAYYLAASSGVLLSNANFPQSPGIQLAIRNYRRLSAAMKKAGLEPIRDVNQFLQEVENVIALRPMAALSSALETLLRDGAREIYLRMQADINVGIAAPEKMAYRDTADLHRQLADYFNERLLAHAPFPKYDEDFLIRQTLQNKLKMRPEDIRDFKFPHMEHMKNGLPLRSLKTPLEEFRKQAEGPRAMASMKFGNLTINAQDEWRALQQQAMKTLVAHPVIVAKSKEAFRMAGKPATVQQRQEIGNLLARNVIPLPREPFSIALLSILESLFGSPTVQSIVNAFTSGDPREILGLLPFIIPLYDIEEGIRLGDKHRAFEGAIHFGEDAILTLLGAGAEGVLRKQLARDAEMMLFAQSRMTAAERAGTRMMQSMQTIMPEAAPDRLARQRIVLDEDAFDVHTEAAETHPKSLEAGYAAGAPDHRTYQMLKLDDDEHATPAIAVNDASTFIETDLRGNPLPDAPPILFEADTRRYRRLNDNDGLPPADKAVSPLEIAQRHTVSETLQYWRGLMKLPGIRVRSTQPADIIRTIFKTNNHALSEEFSQFWIKAYERSETASTIMNRAFQRVADGQAPCRVEFEADHPHAEHSSIWFIGDRELSTMRYTSPLGTEPFRRSRMWVHEAIHWMTDTLDPPLDKMTMHRGPTVYMTDRILNELGYFPSILPRTTYALPPELQAGAESPSATANWGRMLRKINDWSVLENRHLDAALDKQRSYPSTMYLFGQSVAERTTIRQALAFESAFASRGKLARGNISHIFDLLNEIFSAPPSLHFRSKLNTLLRGSKMFLKMAATWHSTPRTAPIKIEMESFATHYHLYENTKKSAFHILENAEKLLFNKESIYYFSERGLEPMGPMRQFAGAMLDLFLRDLSPNSYHLPLNEFHERGAGVLYENMVLQQIGDLSPKRICAALTLNPNAYLPSQTAITRAAASENGYLKHQLNAETRKAIPASDPLQTIPGEEGCSKFLCL